MRYVIHSSFHNQFATLSRRCERWVIARWLCRFAAPILPWFAYAGLVGAAMALFLLPFQIFRLFSLSPPSLPYWVLASLTVAAILFMFGRSVRRVIRGIRQHVIEIEMVALLVGLGLAAALAAYLFPIGWPSH